MVKAHAGIDEFAKILDPIRLTRMAVPVMEESSRMPALPASATASMVSMALKSDLIYCRAFRGSGFRGSRFWVQGSRFRVLDSPFKVQGSPFPPGRRQGFLSFFNIKLFSICPGQGHPKGHYMSSCGLHLGRDISSALETVSRVTYVPARANCRKLISAATE